ncbi:MAG: EI24 domain-containing protein [Burkholderiales bacterium]|nr:EI24 domain-containing protein [Burkholderiales bacterium]
MQDVFAALARAARNLFESRILAIMFLPMFGSIVLWTVLAWIFWDSWTGGIAGAVAGTAVAGWLMQWGAAWVIDSTAVLLVVIAILPAIYVTALIITEIIAMPVIVKFVAERYHASLKREAGGTLIGSVLNAAAGIVVFAVLWIVTLPLWLTGVGAVLAPVLTSAYLNQRMFRYDALAEHASADELARVIRTSRGDLFLLGVLLSLLLYLPLVNLLVPVLSGLAFTHFCLGRLAAGRKITIKTIN